MLDSFLPIAKGVPSNLSSAALLIAALTVAALGMITMIWLASPALMVASMVLFCAGFGVIENATFALLIEQLPEAQASTRWNLAYDTGYGAARPSLARSPPAPASGTASTARPA